MKEEKKEREGGRREGKGERREGKIPLRAKACTPTTPTAGERPELTTLYTSLLLYRSQRILASLWFWRGFCFCLGPQQVCSVLNSWLRNHSWHCSWVPRGMPGIEFGVVAYKANTPSPLDCLSSLLPSFCCWGPQCFSPLKAGVFLKHKDPSDQISESH